MKLGLFDVLLGLFVILPLDILVVSILVVDLLLFLGFVSLQVLVLDAALLQPLLGQIGPEVDVDVLF